MTSDSITTELLDWQTRPLCCQYVVVLFDTLPLQIPKGGELRERPIHLALGVLADGQHEVLGLWTDQPTGAKGWPTVLGQLKDRGVEHIQFTAVHGSKDLSTAVQAAFPATKLHSSIAHLVRQCLLEVTPSDQQPVTTALQPLHSANSGAAAQAALDVFTASPWGTKYPLIALRWQAARQQLAPFMVMPPKTRRVILLADHVLELLHLQLSRGIGRHGHFPSDQAAIAFVWLALRRAMRRTGDNPPAQPRRRLTTRAAKSPML